MLRVLDCIPLYPAGGVSPRRAVLPDLYASLLVEE